MFDTLFSHLRLVVPLKNVTFTIPKGGVGKTLLQANVATALARSGEKVVVLDADPSKAIETMLSTKTDGLTLSQVMARGDSVNEALYKTPVENLYLLPSGLRLESYFSLEPVKLMEKLDDLECDILLVDTPFPLSESAFLALGICHYLILVLTEDEFSLCVESGIDLVRLARYVFDCKPAGFVVNRITGEKITDKLVALVEKAFDVPCIARIKEDAVVRKSYGGPQKKDAYLLYDKFPDSEFSAHVNSIAKFIQQLPEGMEKNPEKLQRILKQATR